MCFFLVFLFTLNLNVYRRSLKFHFPIPFLLPFLCWLHGWVCVTFFVCMICLHHFFCNFSSFLVEFLVISSPCRGNTLFIVVFSLGFLFMLLYLLLMHVSTLCLTGYMNKAAAFSKADARNTVFTVVCGVV